MNDKFLTGFSLLCAAGIGLIIANCAQYFNEDDDRVARTKYHVVCWLGPEVAVDKILDYDPSAYGIVKIDDVRYTGNCKIEKLVEEG